MGKTARSCIIAGAQISPSQMASAGSIRLNEGDRVQIVDRYPGSSEIIGMYGEIKKHRGFGKFMIALDGGNERCFDERFLIKISR